ncbi:PREDICTED: COMM domain-containing protein 5-like [Ceratosolen solmsi marchali]|uniref:COMM domain-containing protein 5 n=1 Tax=Ceratosolen solmsi marchali TaxID=326594 RepID=A0AAJ6YHC6_9HYME|nr:PREDICTED: COMM domain-containing protein 5-like [Ceratosolen solmsi marchali]
MSFQLQLTSLLGNHTKNLSELKQIVIRPLLQIAVKAIEQEYIEEGALEVISKNFNVSQAHVDEWYAAILIIMKLHLRYSSAAIKPTEFKQCLQELKFSPECIQDIFSVLTGPKRLDLITSFTNKVDFFPHLIACKWRVDIIISSNLMSKILEPHVLLEWILSNGESYTFELSLPRFHQMRHAVAKLLLEIQRLEVYNVIKNNA